MCAASTDHDTHGTEFGHAEALELEKLGVQVDWDGVEIFDEEEENPSDSGGENGDD